MSLENAASTRPTAAKRKNRRSQAERTALSDGKMYDAAIELICENGAHNTTLKDIGEKAGFSRGLASNRFGSKEALFSNLVSQFNHHWQDQLRRSVGDRNGIPALVAALSAVEKFLVDEPASMKAMYVLWYESIASHNEIREKLAVYHARYREDVERYIVEGREQGLLREDVEPARFAVQFCSFIFGTIYQWLVCPEAIDVGETFQEFQSMAIDRLVEQPSARNGSA